MASDRHEDAPPPTHDGAVLRLADLAQRRAHRFARQPDADARAALARALDLIDLRKVRFEGTLDPVGRRNWDLNGQLGATVVQPCVATLAPVTTRIEERVERRFRADLPEPDDAAEIEMPEDDALERLPDAIDLDAILAEALALALPPYPRAADTAPVEAQFAEPGQTPMTDADTRPFAALAGLRGQLGRDTGKGETGNGPEESDPDTPPATGTPQQGTGRD
ncbi:YceD family protein [Meridianimarinicoccus sp. RP-17]|uniref:YceD family protein n=1 Tax=Meridianimarinicoccus zhengii TaxID=2056810 RepID=UPI001C9AA002|nr:YceD family protein [Phycocomes zhengii]